jgi:neutral ceramidase
MRILSSLVLFFFFTGFSAFGAESVLKAGFARVKITPPVGTAMTGFGNRDYDPAGSRGIHDDLYARALYLTQGGEDILIMGFDLLFFSREEADRFKGAIGRSFNLRPDRILLNTSHTHTGPKVGAWDYTAPDLLYLQFLEKAIIQAVTQARNSQREVTVWAGASASELPMNRRRKLPSGIIDFAPNPGGAVCNTLPFCLFKDTGGKTVCILFSISCHASTIKGDDRAYWFSADYPGAAMARLDEYLGAAGSLFLQGAAGDAKASVIGKGEEHWRSGTWEDVAGAGNILAEEVIKGVKGNLTRVEPKLRAAAVEMEFPMVKPMSRAEFEAVVKKPFPHSESEPEAMRRWAQEKIAMLDRGYGLPITVSVTVQGIEIGRGLRLIGIEGEIVAELGNQIVRFYGKGVTFPMGYSNGAQIYIPTSRMLDEGGYEVESYWEYRHPAPLAKGIENILEKALTQLKKQGIE